MGTEGPTGCLLRANEKHKKTGSKFFIGSMTEMHQHFSFFPVWFPVYDFLVCSNLLGSVKNMLVRICSSKCWQCHLFHQQGFHITQPCRATPTRIKLVLVSKRLATVQAFISDQDNLDVIVIVLRRWAYRMDMDPKVKLLLESLPLHMVVRANMSVLISTQLKSVFAH